MFENYRWTRRSIERNRLTVEYEPLQPYLLFAMAQQLGCRTFVDVGANIGYYAITASPHFERIVAFEANPLAADEIEKNVALNHLGRKITLQRVAVSDQSGTVMFRRTSDLAGTNAVADDGQIEIAAVRLDDVELGVAPFCMKIDVEGHEPHVLAGAEETLSKPCLIQIETFGKPLDISGYERIVDVGPDSYFSNRPIDLVRAIKNASTAMIEQRHAHKPLVAQAGPLELAVHGKLGGALRKVARRLMGKPTR